MTSEMVTFTVSGSLNRDEVDVKEEAVVMRYAVSSNAVTFTTLVLENGASINVKESLQEVRNAFEKAGKAIS